MSSRPISIPNAITLPTAGAIHEHAYNMPTMLLRSISITVLLPVTKPLAIQTHKEADNFILDSAKNGAENAEVD